MCFKGVFQVFDQNTGHFTFITTCILKVFHTDVKFKTNICKTSVQSNSYFICVSHLANCVTSVIDVLCRRCIIHLSGTYVLHMQFYTCNTCIICVKCENYRCSIHVCKK